MNLELEREARCNAAKIVSNSLQRTNNIDQIRQNRKLRSSKEVSDWVWGVTKSELIFIQFSVSGNWRSDAQDCYADTT